MGPGAMDVRRLIWTLSLSGRGLPVGCGGVPVGLSSLFVEGSWCDSGGRVVVVVVRT